MKTFSGFIVLCIGATTLLTASCKGKSGLSNKERDQLTECTNSISASADADAEMRMKFFVMACGESQGFDKIVEADPSSKMQLLAEKTDYLCNKTVAKAVGEAAPERRAALLIEACGAEYYGLTKDSAHHLSISWFLGQRSAAWIADAMSRASDEDRELVADLKLAMSEFEAPLPIPARAAGLYELPHALDADMVHAMQYILVDGKSTKVVDRATLRLTERGAVLVDSVAAAKTVELAEIYSNLRHEKPEPEEEEAEEEPTQGTGTKMASVEPILEAKQSTGATGQISFKNNRVPPYSARERALDHARRAGVLGILSGDLKEQFVKPEPWAPLLVADKALSARRVLSVVHGMRESGVYMGAAFENHALQAMIPFGRTTPNGIPVRFRAQLLLRDDALELWVTGQTHELARRTDGSYPYDVLAEKLRIKRGGKRTAILISASGNKATYQELVAVLDAAQEVGVELAVTGPGGEKLELTHQLEIPPDVTESDFSAEGTLDKETIRRYVKRKLPRIRHCYQKELQRAPTLSGTVTTSFQIARSGSVKEAVADGLGSKNVENCIVAALQSIQFPKPKGGGVVNVRYSLRLLPTSWLGVGRGR